MILKKYRAIMEREESHRQKWATGLSLALSAFVLVSFAFYKGFINVNVNYESVVKKIVNEQSATVINATDAPSPFVNTKETFEAAFKQIGKEYDNIIESISDVLVPFVTGIDVYERE